MVVTAGDFVTVVGATLTGEVLRFEEAVDNNDDRGLLSSTSIGRVSPPPSTSMSTLAEVVSSDLGALLLLLVVSNAASLAIRLARNSSSDGPSTGGRSSSLEAPAPPPRAQSAMLRRPLMVYAEVREFEGGD
jgi:hypothetical protein